MGKVDTEQSMLNYYKLSFLYNTHKKNTIRIQIIQIIYVALSLLLCGERNECSHRNLLVSLVLLLLLFSLSKLLLLYFHYAIFYGCHFNGVLAGWLASSPITRYVQS